MKSILVVGEDPHSFEAVLTTAWLIAERFESYVEGVAVHALTAPVTSFAGFRGVAVTTLESLESLEAEEVARAAQLKNAFQEFARVGGRPRGARLANLSHTTRNFFAEQDRRTGRRGDRPGHPG